MLQRFVNFIMADGFYWIAMTVGLVAIYMSDNRIKASLFAASYDGDYELIYFDIQGKCQQIRYLFAYLDIEYIDTRLEEENWYEIKASEKYGKGTQLPILVDKKSGEFKNQSVGILRFLCSEFGLVPWGSAGLYELDWYFDTKADFDNVLGVMNAIYTEEATEADIEMTVETFSNFMKRCDVRWADGRQHVTGSNISAADFNLLAFYTSIVTNKGLFYPQVSKKLQEKLANLDHVKRVIENMAYPLKSTIEKLPTGKYF